MIRSLLLVITIVISGCGGNSGGDSRSSSSHSTSISSVVKNEAFSSSAMSSSQSSVNREFGLHKLNSVTLGEVYSSRLEAVNSLGYTEVGRIWIANKAEELLNGILVTPRVIDFIHCSGDCSGSNSLFPRVAWTFTYYIETTTGNVISFKQKNFFHTEILDCRSSSPYHMPSVIRSGDFGATPGFNCAETIIQGETWSALQKIDSQIVLGLKSHGYDARGKIEEFDIQYTLDAEGNIVSVSAGGLSSSTVN